MLYIITGVSKGLGEAIALHCLDNGNKVIGIGRSNAISHPNFSFVSCDLSDKKQVEKLSFPTFNSEVTLINNAGIIGEIKRLSDQSHLDLEGVLQVNTIAPITILHMVYARMETKSDLTVVNISSGAANRAIPSWAAYCASKAALNMLTETFYLEEKEKGNFIKTYAVAPGVIDTDMQVTIRSTAADNFSALDNFKKMKDEEILFSRSEAANRLFSLLSKPYNHDDGKIHFDLRNS